jgi:hypothetical protein
MGDVRHGHARAEVELKKLVVGFGEIGEVFGFGGGGGVGCGGGHGRNVRQESREASEIARMYATARAAAVIEAQLLLLMRFEKEAR